uniref:Uncharacterized protein n=1 Tax=Rhizophora mucronata TaxID=61149 RepID=A0A2P2PWT0_RHIMU
MSKSTTQWGKNKKKPKKGYLHLVHHLSIIYFIYP